MMYKIGIGNDTHRLVSGRKLILGGVEIESELGAAGHSDADALLHAITDALLGALGLGDIGSYFPSTDERWRNSESSIFLTYARRLAENEGYEIVNVDSIVLLESPRLATYIERIRANIAALLAVEAQCVNVKAKTGEGIGIIGRKEAVRAEAVVSINTLRA